MYKALFDQVLFSSLFTEEEEDTSHRPEEQMVAAQWTVREHTVQEHTMQEHMVLKGTVRERKVQGQMVVAALVEAARKMEAGHRVVLSPELPLDHM